MSEELLKSEKEIVEEALAAALLHSSANAQTSDETDKVVQPVLVAGPENKERKKPGRKPRKLSDESDVAQTNEIPYFIIEQLQEDIDAMDKEIACTRKLIGSLEDKIMGLEEQKTRIADFINTYSH